MPRERDEAWREVGRHVGELGSRIREHYEHQVDRRDQPLTQAREAVADALEGVVRRVGDVFDAFSEAVRDPQVREQAVRASRALADAIELSATDLGDGMKQAGKRAGKRRGR